MKKRLLLTSVFILAALVPLEANCAWWWPFSSSDEVKIFGNIDHRQVSLAFKDSERISKVYVQEGDAVKKGQVLAELETARLEEQIAAQQAVLEAAEQALLRLKNGNRPEEIAQAKAEKESAEASVEFARKEHERNLQIDKDTKGRALSKQTVEQTEEQLKVAEAQLNVKVKSLELALIGPRVEDIAQQEAVVAQAKAQLELLKTQLDDAKLISPDDAIVRRRLLEPGDMASSAKAVFSLAIRNPIWVRAYVSEPQMGSFQPGQKVNVYSDSLPDKAIPASVGFVSSMAEFTPKSIETEDLRTSLVYEVRCYINDPPQELKLGMPVTVIPVVE